MTNDRKITKKNEQRRASRDGIVWSPEQRTSYRNAIAEFDRRINRRIGAAFVLVILASTIGAIMAGDQAGKSGARAGRTQVVSEANKFTVQYAKDQLRLQQAQARTLQVRCEATKEANAASAAGWTAHAEYINKVTQAASVKEDVKRAARKAENTYVESAATLTAISNVNCKKLYPIPTKLTR